jgi:hypothetical protein
VGRAYFDTALLMTRFYGGDFPTSPAAALQRVQQWMRDNDDDEKLAELERAIAGAVVDCAGARRAIRGHAALLH